VLSQALVHHAYGDGEARLLEESQVTLLTPVLALSQADRLHVTIQVAQVRERRGALLTHVGGTARG